MSDWLCFCVMWKELGSTDVTIVVKFQDTKWDLSPKSCMAGDIWEFRKAVPGTELWKNRTCLGSSETLLIELESSLEEVSRKRSIQQRKGHVVSTEWVLDFFSLSGLDWGADMVLPTQDDSFIIGISFLCRPLWLFQIIASFPIRLLIPVALLLVLIVMRHIWN